MKQATVAIEDQRFYKHERRRLRGHRARRASRTLASGETSQGGSTLTMQLVRNLYTDRARKQTFKRKIREAKLAEELEDEHPKVSWILTNYLNNVPYGTVGGQTAVGVQAAARVFFDKPASQLTLPRGGAARRPAPGAVALQPVPQPARRAQAPQRGAAPDGRRCA